MAERAVVRFPTRRCSAVFVIREALGGYLVLVRSYGWLFGSFREAYDEAMRFAGSLGLPIRMEGI